MAFIGTKYKPHRLIVYIFMVMFLGWLSPCVNAEIPPVFEHESLNRMQKDELTQVYLTPKRIVWKNEKGGKLVENEHTLLKAGNGQADLTNRMNCVMTTTEIDTASILLDYGKEIQGGLQLVLGHCSSPKPALVRIRFGESVGECNSEVTYSAGRIGFSTNHHAMRDIVMEIPNYGVLEIGNTGFRFVRIDLLEKNTTINVAEARAIFRYRDLPYLGSFRCNDDRLNQIWLTGAYTVHLNMQEYLWDGIKRDRLIWLGDMHPEVATIMAVFGDNEVVPQTLDLACKQFPLPGWMNGMSAYSLWYLIIHHDWYLHSGDLDFLTRHKAYILGLLDLIDSKIDLNGVETLAKERFLDWPSSSNKEGVEAGYRALIVWALKDAEQLCEILNEPDYAQKARLCVNRMNRTIKEPNNLKQAASLMAIAGLLDPVKACREVVSVGSVKNFSTFYGYYMLQSLAMAGEHQQGLDIIRQYWGGMLDVGATTFWEDFNLDWTKNAARIDENTPVGKIDIHGAYGAYCYLGYRHSLCHGWASGPTAWMSEHILGIKAVEPGCRLIKIEPHLGDLQWAEGTYPTPYGVVTVKITRDKNNKINTQVQAPDEIKVIVGK